MGDFIRGDFYRGDFYMGDFFVRGGSRWNITKCSFFCSLLFLFGGVPHENIYCCSLLAAHFYFCLEGYHMRTLTVVHFLTAQCSPLFFCLEGYHMRTSTVVHF
jgi:hypothetical protein